MKIPDDLTPSGDPADPASLDPNVPGTIDLKGAKRRSRPFIVTAVGVILLGLVIFVAWRIYSGHEKAKQHAAFLNLYLGVEKDDVGPFWVCLFGNNIAPSAFSDNLALGNRVEVMFNGDPANFPAKVIEECSPKLDSAAKKAAALVGQGPEEYNEPVAAYAKTILPLGEGINGWAERAKARGARRIVEKKIIAAVNAFHAVAGQPPPEAVAYDRFLRCAVPDIDKIKDGQGLVERLFEECKKPDGNFADHARDECGKHITTPDPKVDAKFKATLKKFGPDDRDVSAWEDCFKRARKGQKQDDLAQFGKAWVDYMAAGRKVSEIGAAELKESK